MSINDLSIIIVNYKTPKLLDNCINSIYDNKDNLTLEIIVVDNQSEDESKRIIATKYPNVIWIDMGYNAGFARANNLGIHRAKGDYILLLNSDTIIPVGFLDEFLSFYKSKDRNNKLGLLGCRIVGIIDNKLQVGSGIGFSGIKDVLHANPIYIFLTRRQQNRNDTYNTEIMHYENHEIDFVSGCCVMIKESKVTENNLFLDEDFFLYSEDIEWSYRVKENGYMNYFCGDVEIQHENGGSTEFGSKKKAQVQISEYLFYLKTNSLLKYNLIGRFILFNFKLDLFLNRRDINNPVIKELSERYEIFKKYYYNDVKKYRKTHKKFLKYGNKY
jgi:GT2 family glycosyltransferase